MGMEEIEEVYYATHRKGRLSLREGGLLFLPIDPRHLHRPKDGSYPAALEPGSSWPKLGVRIYCAVGFLAQAHYLQCGILPNGQDGPDDELN